MALCAYTTLFKLKLFNFYRLVPHQMSDAGSIMFSAKYVVYLYLFSIIVFFLFIFFISYLCRLAAPLAYNFLSIVHQEDLNFTSVSTFIYILFTYIFSIMLII